jgi:hypothetical protein
MVILREMVLSESKHTPVCCQAGLDTGFGNHIRMHCVGIEPTNRAVRQGYSPQYLRGRRIHAL